MSRIRRFSVGLPLVAGALVVLGAPGMAQAECDPDQTLSDTDVSNPCVNESAQNEQSGMATAQQAMIGYTLGSAELDDMARQKLDVLALWANKHENHKIVLAGAVASSGGATANIPLGNQRAQAARSYLIARGVNPDQIQVIPADQTAPQPAAGQKIVLLVDRGAESYAARSQLSQVGQQPYVQPQAAQQVQPAPQPMAAAPSYQQTNIEVQPQVERQRRPIGLTVQLGGGVMDFVKSNTRDFAGVAGTWEARVAYGTNRPVGFEVAYIGSAQSIDALGLDSNAGLLGSAAEGAVRLSAPRLAGWLQPYAFGGVGYVNYHVVNSDFNNSAVDDNENAMSVPLGGGLGLRFAGVIVDLRGTYRPVFNDGLTQAETGLEDESSPGDVAELDNWSATANVGFEF